MLGIHSVSKSYLVGGVRRTVLNKISLEFRRSEFVAILGPSGSGKTTLLNIIGGLDRYDSGDLLIDGKSTKRFRDKDWDSYRNHRVGFVFQSYNLIPHQTVLQNVRLALTLSGISKHESISRAKKILREVGLGDHMDKRPAQLSGGQMQRVAIARALVNDPEILLADEPTGALDSETSIQIMNLLKKIANKKLVIMVTHNPELAREYATRIITLKDGKITSDSDVYNGKNEPLGEHLKNNKTRMSFLTATGLSMRNLLTKKARTILIAIAGSIGIIGIALISAVSTGFQNYIDKIEKDTLTSYPLALMKESADMTGLLLSFSGSDNNTQVEDGKILEKQNLTSTLGSVTNNDLPSFAKYLDEHNSEIKDDVRLMEYEYNVNPLIYTKDATGEIAKMNPSGLFTSLVGESSLLRNYSSMTSVFRQYELENLKSDTDLLAGKYPEKYNEMIVVLSSKNQVSELITYSLGFHDTNELNEIVAKIMSGEKVKIDNKPLELTYEDLMKVDLRLVPATETYKFNSKYDVYEDMANDKEYMQNIYNSAEHLKIVGVAVMNSEMATSSGGIVYLPSLVTHIIDKASQTEIVKKQLENPTIDIFSNTKFGEEKQGTNFEFSDLVSIDEQKLASAFGGKIDRNAISNKTGEYIEQISEDIDINITPIREVFVDKYKDLAEKMKTELLVVGKFKKAEIETIVGEFVGRQNFEDFTNEYYLPEEVVKELYNGLLVGTLEGYVSAYAMTQITNPSFDVETSDIIVNNMIYDNVVTGCLDSVKFNLAFETLATQLAEVKMKQEILTEVSGLATYLSNSFAEAMKVDQDAIIGAFKLNFTEDELSRVVTAMFTKKKTTLATNLSALGYQDLADPTEMAFYFWSFDGKVKFMKFLDDYNDKMRSTGQEDKVIEYSDTTGALISSVKTIVDAVSYVLIAFVSISLVVSSIMIGVITYISVYERTKEIGILRSIGASKRNISSIFNAETFIIGLMSGVFGVIISYILIIPINAVLHIFTGDLPLNAMLDPKTAAFLILLSVALTLIAGIIPSRSASKKDPVEALRSE